jgi:DNA-binding NarL/FixJ family response regulator
VVTDCLTGIPFLCRFLAEDKTLDRPRVILADDHEEFLLLAQRLLESEFDVVKTVGNGQALIEEATRLGPGLLIIDISMPVLNGIEATRRLRNAGNSAKIVFLTVHTDVDYVRASLSAGAQGYVVKNRLASDLLPALNEVLAGRSFVSPTISMKAGSLNDPSGGETS